MTPQEKAEARPSAYIAGIIQGDGDDLHGARIGDLMLVMRDTKENRRIQCAFLKGELPEAGAVQRLVEALEKCKFAAKDIQSYLESEGGEAHTLAEQIKAMAEAALTPFQQKR